MPAASGVIIFVSPKLARIHSKFRHQLLEFGNTDDCIQSQDLSKRYRKGDEVEFLVDHRQTSEGPTWRAASVALASEVRVGKAVIETIQDTYARGHSDQHGEIHFHARRLEIFRKTQGNLDLRKHLKTGDEFQYKAIPQPSGQWYKAIEISIKRLLPKPLIEKKTKNSSCQSDVVAAFPSISTNSTIPEKKCWSLYTSDTDTDTFSSPISSGSPLSEPWNDEELWKELEAELWAAVRSQEEDLLAEKKSATVLFAGKEKPKRADCSSLKMILGDSEVFRVCASKFPETLRKLILENAPCLKLLVQEPFQYSQAT